MPCPCVTTRKIENVPTVDILAGDGFSDFLVYRSQDYRSWEAKGGEARWMGSAVVFIWHSVSKTRAGSLAVRRGFLTLTLPLSPTLSHSLFLLSLTLSLCHSISLSHSFSLSLSLSLYLTLSLSLFLSLTLSHAQTFSQLSPDDIWNNFHFDT